MVYDFQVKQTMKLLPLEVKKGKKAIVKKLLMVLVEANQNICVQQACENTGLYSHSKHILNYFKKFSLEQIKEFFFESALAMLKLSIPQLNLRYLKLAVDITEEPYYGKIQQGDVFIWSRTPKSPAGATGCYKYLTISATNSNCKLILFNIMLQPGYMVEDIIPLALDEIQMLIRIKQVTFDRGFDNHKLVYELERFKIKYLIFSKKNKSNKKIFDDIEEGNSFSQIRNLSFYKWGCKYSCEARFVYIKAFQFKETEEAFDWIFITNINFESIRHTIASYRNRWGIETIFRVLKQDFRIKTTSRHQAVRLMCWFFSMLFYNIWQLAKYFISFDVKAKNFFNIVRYGFKRKYELKSEFEDQILDFVGLS